MSRARVRRLVSVAAGLVLLSQVGAQAADPPRLTKPVQATKDDLNPDRTYSAPFLLAHPDDPLLVVGSYIDLRTKRCALIRSTDGGQSWKRLEAAPAPPSYPFCLMPNSNIFHGPMAWGSNNTLYYALAGWDIQDGSTALGNISVILARSTNYGDTWTSTLVRDTRGKTGLDLENNRPVGGVAVDTTSGNDDIVYVTWQSRASAQRTGPNQVPDRSFVAVSTDGGRTFGDQVHLSGDVYANAAVRAEALQTTTTLAPAPGASTTSTTAPPPDSKAARPDLADNFGGRNPAVAVDAKGNAYVFWHSVTSNISPSPSMGHFLSKSTDKGKTWTTTQIAPFSNRNSLATRFIWSPEGGPDGSLHLVQQGTDRPELGSYQTIMYRRSTDGGATWSERRMLADLPAEALQGQYAPNISLAPNGRIDVAWWDTRDDPGIRSNDVYYTYSTDNGDTWSKNMRITDQTVNRNWGVWGFNFDMSSPPGIASANEHALFSWDDTRHTNPAFADNQAVGGGLQDIFTANVQFSAVGGGMSKAAKIAMAAVAGLVGVGLALLVATTISRRRSTGPRSPAHQTGKTPAGVG